MINSVLLRAMGLCLMLLPSLVAADDDWLGLADGKVHVVTEPVFEDSAWIYEAGIGNRETIVLVHGLGTVGADDWKPLIPTLARDYHVVTFDLPGFARSGKGNYMYTPSTYARFIDFVVDKYVKGKFHLVGHSMGGAIAARYSASLPERVESLTLIDAAGILHRAAFQKHLAIGAIEKNIPPVYATQDAEARELIMWIIDQAEPFGMGPELVLRAGPLRQALLKGDPLRISGLGLVVEDFSDLAWTLKTPVQLIWGDRDSVAPLRTGRLLDEILPHADLKILPGTGHNPMAQSADKLMPILLDFIRGKTSVADQPAIAAVTTRPGDKALRCSNQSNMQVPAGSYSEIIIDGCKGLVMKQVHAGKITIRNLSEVELEDVIVDGGEIAMEITDSTVTITNGRIKGEVVFKAENSRVDVAGTHLIAGRFLARSEVESSFVFSIVHAETPGQKRYIHDYVRTNEIRSM